MKRVVITVVALALTVVASAKVENGGIDAKMMEQLRKGYTASPEQKAVKNALASTPINTLATNGENLAMCDTHFSHRVKTSGITNQKSSGRCWLFTGLNVLRAKMINKHNLGTMEFSQNYCSFYDLLEKSNLFLQAIIDTHNLPLEDRKVDWLLHNPIGDGGQFTGVSNLVMKYGIVPKEVMPETYQSNNTRQMRTILSLKLREYALALRATDKKLLATKKVEMLTEIYRILVESLYALVILGELEALQHLQEVGVLRHSHRCVVETRHRILGWCLRYILGQIDLYNCLRSEDRLGGLTY